jgi:hypothetical protein
MSDASEFAIGGVLGQVYEEKIFLWHILVHLFEYTIEMRECSTITINVY